MMTTSNTSTSVGLRDIQKSKRHFADFMVEKIILRTPLQYAQFQYEQRYQCTVSVCLEGSDSGLDRSKDYVPNHESQ
jgi:hypothetical protein